VSTILAIESTCDETASAVVSGGVQVRSSIVATQFELHRKFRGVVPEIASRAHIERIVPVVREAMTRASVDWETIDAVAVAHRPGLIGSLLVGVTFAKALAWSIDRPLIGVDHVHAHLYSVVLDSDVRVQFPAVGLVVSGGHTALYVLNSWRDVTMVGSTIDDAVGEAYDKVSAILGLEFPGGPIVDRLAQNGEASVAFPRSYLSRQSLDFSFSGLKTAVLYHVRGVPGKPPRLNPVDERERRDICASFQAACVQTLVRKVRRACERFEANSVIVGGGVSANSGLRAALNDFAVPVYFPMLKYCTDNAAMIGGLAHELFVAGQFSPLSLDAITQSGIPRVS
jgi:N6-L-threonylcarbamoyladenine synthase